jgi:hypothetical protein
MRSEETYAGFVAINAGIIQEVEHEGELRIMDEPTNANGIISPFIASNFDGAQIKDINFKGRLQNTHASITSFFNSFAGSINRMIVSWQDTMGTDFSNQNSIIPVFGATEMVCVKGSSMAGCHVGPMSYTLSPAGFTILDNSAVVANFTDWNMSGGFLPDMTKTWKLDGLITSGVTTSTEPPELMRTGGDFSQIGAGF